MKTMKVLIVDDNQENLDMVEYLLKANNFEISKALNGKIALEILKNEKHELIISDILMPVMDGFQFCRECKTDPRLKDILFVFYTATYVDQKDEEFALSLGAQKFIRKPQEPDIFLKTINEVIKNAEKFTTKPIEKEEKEILKLYNERLISKLEKKNLDLEKEIEAHKKTVCELIKAKEKAEESDKLKSAFLANMRHEIRTPLNNIVGFIKIIAKNDPNETKHKEMAEIVDFNSKVLIKIIDDIIDISKIEANNLTINNEIINIDKLINNIVAANQIAKKELSKENVELIFNKNNKNGSVLADRIRLTQVLNNLISNALKYTEEGIVEIGYTITENNNVKFYVKDTGIGIPKNEADKIFSRFFKGSNNYTTIRGMGLGLSLTKQLVEMMGGDICFETEENTGSTFYVTLPFIEQITPSDEKITVNKIKDIKCKNILVAEDDNGNFLLTQNVLKKAGANVIRAENGREAVDICKKRNDIDFVLMDIKMPVMDGLEATKIIKEMNPNLIVIALSAFVFTDFGENIFSAGFDHFISKPFDIDTFIAVLQKI